jgi:xanthine permease XanP
MSNNETSNSELIYALDDRPPFVQSFFAALQHVLASFVGIITPTLIIGGSLGLGQHLSYLISMSLMVSGVGTFIQARRIGPVGAGMICVQGTSFAFLGSILAIGHSIKAGGGTPDDILSAIFGVCFLAAFVEVVLSQFITKLRKIISPLVTGIVITTIGLSLIGVGITDLGGGFPLLHGQFGLDKAEYGNLSNLAVGFFVLALVILLNQVNNPWIRIASIVIGMAAGTALAMVLGIANFNVGDVDLLSLPVPFKFGFSFDIAAFISIGIIYVLTAIETTGDITANCMVSKQPVKGASYLDRIKRGVLGDGVISIIASTFNSFPSTTFSQNNGVIQLTGVASRHIGMFIGVILIILGLFPVVGAILQNIPKPVLGGATLIMFGTVASAGIKILSTENLNRRNLLIMAVSFGLGLGVALRPEIFQHLPSALNGILSNPVTVAGISAIFLTLVLSEEKSSENVSEERSMEALGESA